MFSKNQERKKILNTVTPVWPGQSWFPSLMELACDIAKLIPIFPQRLLSPAGTTYFNIQRPSISLVEVVRDMFREQGIPLDAIELILVGGRQSPHLANGSACNNWHHRCVPRNLDYLSNKSIQKLEFLTFLLVSKNLSALVTYTHKHHRSLDQIVSEPPWYSNKKIFGILNKECGSFKCGKTRNVHRCH